MLGLSYWVEHIILLDFDPPSEHLPFSTMSPNFACIDLAKKRLGTKKVQWSTQGLNASRPLTPADELKQEIYQNWVWMCFWLTIHVLFFHGLWFNPSPDAEKRVRNCFGNYVFSLLSFFGGERSAFLPSLLFAAFWGWKVPFQLSLQHFRVRERSEKAKTRRTIKAEKQGRAEKRESEKQKRKEAGKQTSKQNAQNGREKTTTTTTTTCKKKVKQHRRISPRCCLHIGGTLFFRLIFTRNTLIKREKSHGTGPPHPMGGLLGRRGVRLKAHVVASTGHAPGAQDMFPCLYFCSGIKETVGDVVDAFFLAISGVFWRLYEIVLKKIFFLGKK